MKIGILTWLHNNNYGTVLQAYALQYFLRDNSFDVTNIDYSPNSIQKTINLIKYRNSVLLFLEKKQAYKAKKKCTAEEIASKELKFERFLSDKFILSRKYKKPKELLECDNKYDLLICGSDQIWSPELLNPVFYLNFIKETPKISYATSFGVSLIAKKHKEEKIKKLLENYVAISVREIEGKNILEKIGFLDVALVADPTLLIERNHWNLVAKKVECKRPYLLCYLLSDNSEYYENIQKYAKENGLLILTIPVDVASYQFGDMSLKNAGPEEWVGAIKNAEIVCTDSYHGLIFSTIFEKKCRVFKRFQDDNRKSQNSRIYYLLDVMGVVGSFDGKCYIDIAEKQYPTINERLGAYVKFSQEWLINKIRKVENADE